METAYQHLLDAAKQVLEITDAHVSLYSGDEVLTRLSAAIHEVDVATGNVLHRFVLWSWECLSECSP